MTTDSSLEVYAMLAARGYELLSWMLPVVALALGLAFTERLLPQLLRLVRVRWGLFSGGGSSRSGSGVRTARVRTAEGSTAQAPSPSGSYTSSNERR